MDLELQELRSLGIEARTVGTYGDHWMHESEPKYITVQSPIDLKTVAMVTATSDRYLEQVVCRSAEVFNSWRLYPAPKRGELVRKIGDAFRQKKSALAKLITVEMGKPISESEGEIQEVIDICDFAVGLSRQLYGATMHSERPQHRMYEQWHPLGPIGVITAFNFPAAVWAWNAMIAAVCGDTVIWKGSEATPLVSVACMKLCEKIFEAAGFAGVFSLVTGDRSLGEKLVNDQRIKLISATGSTAMGRAVGEAVAKRLGRSLLELGGNNAIAVLKDANLELAARAVAFGAAGTSGQRCTTTRRLLVEREIADQLSKRIQTIYAALKIGNPLLKSNQLGPLINKKAVESYERAIEQARKEGGEILYGGQLINGLPSQLYVEPTLIRASRSMSIVREETFAPILYLIGIADLAEAIEANNEVPHGLSSSIFTNDLRSAEHYLSAVGSDCGIGNVNIGTSGAEIGGAFGGEKDTGGGREAGSDSWKAYMRRQTTTINWGSDLPLAQGVEFGV